LHLQKVTQTSGWASAQTTAQIYMMDETGRSMCKPSLLTQPCSFARQWDKNLKDQGFIDAFAFDSAGNCKMCGEAGRCHCENPNIKEPK
jgi:predicted metal-binding protein